MKPNKEQEPNGEMQSICLRGGGHAYPPADGVLRALRKRLNAGLNHKQNQLMEVREAYAKGWKVNPEHLQVAAGREAALQMLLKGTKTLYLPAVSEPIYREIAAGLKLNIKELPLKDDYTVELTVAGDQETVLLQNPGYPIGKGITAEELTSLLASRKGLVIVDETYFGFGAVSLLPLMEKYENLAVIRSLEVTASLAALPFACILKQGAKADYSPSSLQLPGDLAQTAAMAALKSKRTSGARCNTVRAVREGTAVALRCIGFDVIPSQGNFFLMKYWRQTAAEIALHLTEQGYLTDTVTLGGEEWIAVTIGTKEVMRTWVDVVEGFAEEEWVLHRFDTM